MQLTIPTIAIAAATFSATFAFAPAIASVAEHFTFEQSRIVQDSSPVEEDRHCRSLVAQIVAGLSGKTCV